MKFILPRLIGLTVIAGIGALVLTMVFKVLLFATVAGIVIYFAARRMAHKRGLGPGHQQALPFGQMERAPFHPFQQNEVVPVYQQQRSSGIIPIN